MTNKKNIILQIAIIIVLTGVLYYSTFGWLYDRYVSSDSYYSHGFLIPFISAFLIWLKRDDLKKIKQEYCSLGLFIVLFSMIIHFMSVLAEVFFVSGFSLFLLITGISLYLYGKKITKKILFPLIFLIFMFPLPMVAINGISFPMKMFATKSAVFILKNIFNLSMQNEGFHIIFPKSSLVVGNPCSGLRSLISMLALGSIFAYFLKSSILKKTIQWLHLPSLKNLMNAFCL